MAAGVRTAVFAAIVCFAPISGARAQSDAAMAPTTVDDATAPRHGHATERDAARAAALARGRQRFFSNVVGFDHLGDDPLATGALPPGTTSLPLVKLPPIRRH